VHDVVNGPLSGVRVLDLTRVLGGPYATMIMADLGADVIKIEAPWGDDTRAWGPPWLGSESVYYLAINRGKRSAVLDLTRLEDRETLLKLMDASDVMVESFRPGQLERFGLGFEDVLHPRNPRLILASLSGYGRTGPAREKPGYATLLEGETGYMHVTGQANGPATKLGIALVDVMSGLYLMNAITSALFDRTRTGTGTHVSVSLLESALSSLVNVAANHVIGGLEPQRHGNEHPTIAPFGAFPAKDRDILIAVGNDRQFTVLCEILGLPDAAADPRFMTNPMRCEHREALETEVLSRLRERPAQEWADAGLAAGIPIGLINTVSEAFADPQAKHLKMVHEVNHPVLGRIQTVRQPMSFDGVAPVSDRHPPVLGEHTVEILAELDL